MKILYVGMRYDYGVPERGYSFEHCNFFDALSKMGHDVLYFDFMTLMQQHGRAAMNARLREAAASEQPDLMFCLLFKEELDRGVVKAITRRGAFPTFNWFCDDHWRFDDFSRHWAPCFTLVSTTAQSALAKYARIGLRDVLKTQWACNHYLYAREALPLAYDVTFVGQPHGTRRATIAQLQAAGIDVRTWGLGWDSGRLSQEEMIRCFTQSRINLNLANASVAAPPGRMGRLRQLVKRGATAVLNLTPAGRALKDRLKAARAEAPAPARMLPEQIKGRNFEVPGCGGFLLTSPVENLEQYYLPDTEICLFSSEAELAEKIRYYLEHEDARAAIADAGYRRTLSEHTYVHRFTEIFHRLGLRCDDAETVIARGAQPGRVVDIT